MSETRKGTVVIGGYIGRAKAAREVSLRLKLGYVSIKVLVSRNLACLPTSRYARMTDIMRLFDLFISRRRKIS